MSCCDGSGFVEVVVEDPVFRNKKRGYRECVCRRQKWLESRFTSSIQGRWSRDRFETYDRRKQPAAYEQVLKWAESPSVSLYLFGGTGTGKTHLAISAGRACVDQGMSVLFVNVVDMLDRLRPGNDDDVEKFIRGLETCDVLVIDDLGTERDTEWTTERLYSVINKRYNAEKINVITSNVPVAKIADPRIRSRIVGDCRVVPMIGEDYRELQSRERAA